MVAVRIEQSDGDDDAPARAPDVPDAPAFRQPPDSGGVLDATAAAGESGGQDGPEAPDTTVVRQVRIDRVMDHRATVDTAYRAYAIDQAYKKIHEIERGTVTPAMKRIEAEDPDRHLAGLENRLKGKDRLAEKAIFDVRKKGVTVDQAVANVKDVIRYTFRYPEGSYTAGVYADCDRLADHGLNSSNGGTHGTRSSTKESTAGGELPQAANCSSFSFIPEQASTPKKRLTGRTRSCG